MELFRKSSWLFCVLGISQGIPYSQCSNNFFCLQYCGAIFWEVFRNPGIKVIFKSWLFELICHWFWVVNGKRDPFTNELRPHLILHTRCLIEVLKEIWRIIGILNQKKNHKRRFLDEWAFTISQRNMRNNCLYKWM